MAFILSGCGSELTSDYFDTDAELSKDAFKEGLAAQAPTASPPPPPPPIPDLQPVISTPALGAEIRSRRVTVAVTETTPLKDVLIELAREARIGLELDPRIEGGVIFSAYDRPFDEVLRRLSDLAGLRHKFNDGFMRIELDDPYHVNYKLGYLSLVRSATSEITTKSTVVGGGDNVTGRSAGGGSSKSTVSNQSEADFWGELIADLTQILTNTATRTGLVAAAAPSVSAEAITPLPTTVSPAVTTTPSAADVIDSLLGVPQATSTASPQGLLTPRAAVFASTSAGESLARQTAASATGAAIPNLTPAFAAASSLFTVNRQAGIVSVFGTERQHRQVEVYLRALRKSVSAQVLIEAKILEVTLDDRFRFGINWAMIGSGIINAAAPLNTATTPAVTAPPFDQLIGFAGANPVTATANVFTLGINNENFDVIANAIEQFGTVRALSNPRITVMQNQTAVLKVATEQVFFSEEVTPGGVTDAGTGDAVTNTIINTVTVGLIMTVQPSINLETDEITLTLRPTITRVASEEVNPSTLSLIPELGVQEIDSVVTVRSGNVIVMGGLMQDRTTINEFGVPILSDIPWLGRAFKSTDRTTTKTELVIFLRATIIRNDSVDAYDIKLYDQFGNDRRPLVF